MIMIIQFNFLVLLIGISIWSSLFSFEQFAVAESEIDKTAKYHKDFVNTEDNGYQVPREMIAITNMITAWQDEEYERMLELFSVHYTKNLFIGSMTQANIPIKDWTILETDDGFKVTYKIPDFRYILAALTNKDYQNAFYQLRNIDGGAWRKRVEKWHVQREENKFIVNFHKKGIIPFSYSIGRNAGRNLLLEEKLQIIKNSYKKYYELDEKAGSSVKPGLLLHVIVNTNPEGACLEIDDEDYGLTPSNNILLKKGFHNIKITLNNVIIVNENLELKYTNKVYLYKLSDYLISLEKLDELVKIGGPADAILINALKDNISDDKLSIVTKLLGRIGNIQAVKPLINLLTNDSGEVRMNAINALGEINDISALAAIREVVRRDIDPDVSRVAKAVCKRMVEYHSDYKAIENIVDKLNDEIRLDNFEENFQFIINNEIWTLDDFSNTYQLMIRSFGNIAIEILKDKANIKYLLNGDLNKIDDHEILPQNSAMILLTLKKKKNSWKLSTARIINLYNKNEPSYSRPVRVNLESSYGIYDDEGLKDIFDNNNFFEFNWNNTGNFDNDFKLIKDDKVVIDLATGLMWHQSGSENEIIWKDEVEKWLSEINNKKYAGFNNWRLPTIEESLSLLESNNKNGLFVDQIFDIKQSRIWTADRNGNSKDDLPPFFVPPLKLEFMFRQTVGA